MNYAKLAVAFLLSLAASSLSARELKTRNVVLITADGLRHQELFTGVDPMLLDDKKGSGIQNVESLRERYWRDTPDERRETLLPFFWGTLAPRGIVLGNVARGSRVHLTNPHRISYPGYAEILTGRAQEAIRDNSPVRNPSETVLEIVRRNLDLDQKRVAAFASWSVFDFITAREEGAIFSNAGYEAMPKDVLTPAMEPLNRLQFDMMTPWDTVRFDSVTLGLALEYLKTYRPRFLYLALGETDDWAHDRRYDRTIHAVRLFDDALRELWNLLQSLPEYRDKTTLVLSTDHGRGRTTKDWTSHGSDVEGSDEIWIAFIGPDTPDRGEVAHSEVFTQNQIAATVLTLFSLEPEELAPGSGRPIELALESVEAQD
ncbi:MAG: phosphoglyceromutase [Vicinamibacteria bacterium]